MNEALNGIAARYASALKMAEVFSSDPEEDRPTVTDIWLWQLENTVGALVSAGAAREAAPDATYNHLALYAHRQCLKSKEDVENAPDDVLLEALQLNKVKDWGWLHFIVREMGMTSLLINNWGWRGLQGFEDVRLAAPETERRAQAVHYFLDLMGERGRDPLTDVRRLADTIKAKLKKENAEVSEAQFTEWLRGHNEWLYFVYALGGSAIKPEVQSKLEVQYIGDFRAQFGSEIRAAAERRRQNWNAPYSCDCQESQADSKDDSEQMID